jgi:hypothetical protein
MPPCVTTELPGDIPAAIHHAKAQLRERIGDVAGVLGEVEAAMRAEVAAVVAEREAGRELFPIVRFADIAAGAVPVDTVASIRRRGCAVVKGTFPRARAEQWNTALGAYLEDNRFAERYRGPADDVFSGLASSKPQIYGVYWSKAQMEARQDDNMVAVRSFLNSFWRHESDMRPTDGVLHVVPIPSAMAYVLLRALPDDVVDDDLCGAVNGQVLPIDERWHSVLLPALSPIPAVEPGDTVWWHCDLIHCVTDDTTQQRRGNVMYIPSSPYCEKNAVYAVGCGQAFLTGASPSDFAPEDYEVTWTGRATVADLNPVGRKQLGLEAW